MGLMRVTVIGCAGSFPGPSSPASCYLFEADGFRLAVDMGNGALGVLQRHAGIAGIDAVLLSHLHADHCVDLYAYRIARRYAPDGPMPAIPVYAPSGALERLAKIHGFDDDDGMAEQFEFSTLPAGPPLDRPVRRRGGACQPSRGGIRLPALGWRHVGHVLGGHRGERRACAARHGC